MKKISAREENTKPVVNVLLSVCKPNSKWLTDQIQSVEKQMNVNASLVIRNDCSTDIGIPWSDSPFILEPSEHLGVGASYLALLAESKSGGIAFCDQDDVWHKMKLTMQMKSLSGIKTPALSYCDFQVVNSDLDFIKVKRTPKRITKFTFLFRNNIPGFSIYLNDEARIFLKKSKSYLPKEGFHDWWTLLAISQVGICIRVPYVLASYRLHDTNVIGLSLTNWKRLKRLKQRLKAGLGESKALIDQMIKYLEHTNEKNHGYVFLNNVAQGMKLRRGKRLQILIREGILKSPLSEVLIVMFLYVIPKRISL
jgi:glycosyltransferase involved in cell wall biosynthesis